MKILQYQVLLPAIYSYRSLFKLSKESITTALSSTEEILPPELLLFGVQSGMFSYAHKIKIESYREKLPQHLSYRLFQQLSVLL